MSRIGRKPIPLPSGVKIALQNDRVEVQGPKGKLTVPLPHGITFEQKDGVLNALRATEDHRALHGLARALVANAVTGVTTGFKKDLDIVGVGYRAELKGKMVAFALGKSHPIEFHDSRRHPDRRREANAPGRKRRGQRSSRASRGGHPLAAPTRSIQAKRRPHHRRTSEEKGRQGWSEGRRRIAVEGLETRRL